MTRRCRPTVNVRLACIPAELVASRSSTAGSQPWLNGSVHWFPNVGMRQLIVFQGDTIKADAVYRTALEKLLSTNDPVEFSTTIERYTGSLTDISFRDMDTSKSYPVQELRRYPLTNVKPASSFYQLCTFSAKIPSTALAQRYGTTGWYWYVPFEVVINLGTSELTCHLEWKENVSPS